MPDKETIVKYLGYLIAALTIVIELLTGNTLTSLLGVPSKPEVELRQLREQRKTSCPCPCDECLCALPDHRMDWRTDRGRLTLSAQHPGIWVSRTLADGRRNQVCLYARTDHAAVGVYHPSDLDRGCTAAIATGEFGGGVVQLLDTDGRRHWLTVDNGKLLFNGKPIADVGRGQAGEAGQVGEAFDEEACLRRWRFRRPLRRGTCYGCCRSVC